MNFRPSNNQKNVSPVLTAGAVSTEGRLGDWYFNASQFVAAVVDGAFADLNDSGIPVIDLDAFYSRIGIQRFERIGKQVNPVTLCQYALGCLWKYHAENDEQYKTSFIRCARWLWSEAELIGGSAFWLHRWSEPTYHLPVPWISGMAQGEALSVLLRAYEITGEAKYMVRAEEALRSFQEQAGPYVCTVPLSSTANWYEEYPGGAEPAYVLNGHIFALLGIFDFVRCRRTPEAQTLWEQGLAGLRLKLTAFDNGYWTWYDLMRPHIASALYHDLHILQLRVLWELTQASWLNPYIQRWPRYQKSSYNIFRRRLRGLRQRFFIR